MSLSAADIHRIAHLARIEIDAAQAEEVRAKLDAIFAMINELQAVDTTGVVPMAHAQDVMLPLREDLRHRNRPAFALPGRRACGRGWPLSRAEGHRMSERNR